MRVFPQEELLTAEIGAQFLGMQTYCAVAVHKKTQGVF